MTYLKKDGYRVIATLTSIPKRYSTLMEVLKCLNKQTRPLDAIYVCIPVEYRKFKDEIELPKGINKLCTIIRSNEDYGPLSKIYGALTMEDDPNTIILSFDDDCEIPDNMVEVLIEKHKQYPDSAIASNGMLFGHGIPFFAIIRNREGSDYHGPDRKVDTLLGGCGALYLRHFFPLNSSKLKKFFDLPLNDENFFTNDDFVISAYLAKNGIKRMVCGGIPYTKFMWNKVDNRYSNGSQPNACLKGALAIKKLMEEGYFPEYAEVQITETHAGKIAIIITSVIVLAIFMTLFVWTFS